MKHFLMLALSCVVAACGNSQKQNSGSYLPLLQPQQTSPDPIRMSKEVDYCSTNKSDNFDYVLTLFLNGRLTTESRNFVGLIDNQFVRDIKGKSVSSTTYGEEYYVVQQFENGQFVSGHYEQEPKAAREVTICPDQKEYHRDSIEAASLNAAYYINQVYKKVTHALPEVNVTPVSIRVGTLIKVTKVQAQRDGIARLIEYWVDNAMYEPATSSITFVPHSKRTRPTDREPNYWDIPMVAAHEYGHHVFHMVAPQKNSSTMITGCFTRHDKKHQLFGTDAAVEVKNETVENALNEGFADLMASYTLKPEEVSLKGVWGLAVDREVTHASFRLNGEKRFTDFVLKNFFSPRSTEIPDLFFQDTHTIGAIFAHRADHFLNTLGANKDQKLTILLKWAKEYGATRDSMSGLSPRAYLDKMLQLFIRRALKHTSTTDTASQCETIVDFYPGFSKTFAECASFE